MKNPFEAFFRPRPEKEAEVGGAAAKMTDLSSDLPLVRPEKYVSYAPQQTPEELKAHQDALAKASDEAGVVWDTTASMKRVGPDGLPIDVKK